jgi:hypothetical protein
MKAEDRTVLLGSYARPRGRCYGWLIGGVFAALQYIRARHFSLGRILLSLDRISVKRTLVAQFAQSEITRRQWPNPGGCAIIKQYRASLAPAPVPLPLQFSCGRIGSNTALTRNAGNRLRCGRCRPHRDSCRSAPRSVPDLSCPDFPSGAGRRLG